MGSCRRGGPAAGLEGPAAGGGGETCIQLAYKPCTSVPADAPAPPTGEHELLPRGRSAAQIAYDYVKARLLDGRFAGGTLLSENEIAQRLDVSRTPVRQAFVQLEAEGLLELYPRRGALVVPISPSEAEDVLEARMLIEQHSARRAAHAGPALAAALRGHIAEQEEALGAAPASPGPTGTSTARSSRRPATGS